MEKEAGGSPPLLSPPPPPPIIPPNEKPEKLDSPKRSIISRRGFGSTGRRISLLTNHFKVSVKYPDEIFYQYSVSISSEDKRAVESKGIGRKVIDKLYQTYSSELGGKKFAYDGEKSFYTVGPLPQNNLEFIVVLEESFAKRGSPSHDGSLSESSKRSKRSFQSKAFKVEVSYAAKIPLKSISLALQGSEAENTQDAVRVLDIILRQQAANRGCLLVRQSFFHGDSSNFHDVGGGVTGCQGFHSSFRPTHGGLSLNMDVSTTMILTPGPVIDFLLANQNARDPRYIDWGKAKKMLKNMRIKTTHSKMEFKIIGLSEKPCNQQLFPLKVNNGDGGHDGGQTLEITVYDYFKKHRSKDLTKSAYMPCVDVGKPKRPVYLPLELCTLVSLQRYTKALSSMQRASLVEKSRQKPQERIRVVTAAVRNYDYDDDPLLAACGISIEKQLTQVEGRVLEAPRLKVGNSEDCIPRDGRWNFNNKQLFTPIRIEQWAVVNFSARCDTSHLSRELINCGRKKGIHIERPHTLIEEDPQCRRSGPVTRVEKMFELITAKLPGPPQFLLCVLPERKNSDIYGPWKKKSLSDFGIATQCISPSKINDQYLTNVLLKINSKLGGTNSLLALEHSSRIPLVKDTPTMILGMDVSHGSPGRSDIPSIAAVVGSRSWPLISRYRAAVRTQSSKVEMIESLFKPLANGKDDGIMRELLVDFYQTSNGRKPAHIIVFRDGVSESQFNQVLNIELDQMIKAYQHLGEVDIPKFTVIVAQKNHHTKLFLAGASATLSPSSPPRMPRRLRRRLLESKTSPSTVEEIEAKLRDADLRRQKFYENLSSKARPKPRSPSHSSSSHEDDLGQRLEAKLQAAEQKRLSILTKAQLRLAKLDELRQAAKNGAEMRFKKECAELGTKVESRVQKAEANRMLLLNAHRQRRAMVKERTSQSLLRRMARENKYKERVRVAIFQKRAAAEKKRLGLLEAEKKRARARILQVRKVAKSVSYQREIERRKMKDKLEDRLQRARRQRAEYLSQRGKLHSPVRVNWTKMHKQADLLSRKVARCWRLFLRRNKTSLDLAKAYDALNINERYVKSMPFEQLALLIESSATLQTVKALLDRLENRYILSKSVRATFDPSSWDDIDHLLKLVASPNKRSTPRKSTRSKDAKTRGSIREAAKSPVRLSRYQVRVVLCAYMILGHPDAVFSGQGEREIALAKSAEKFVQEFELLIKIILDGPVQISNEESDPALSRRGTFRSQLAAFDASWCTYLNSFVGWKVKDAESLEEDLVRAACQLELSMIQTCKMTPDGGDSGTLTHDMKAIQKQVTKDQKLLREKVHHLSGDAGIERMEFALSDTRKKYFQAKENGSPVGSPIMNILSPSLPSSPASVATSDRRGNTSKGNQRPRPVVRSLFRDDSPPPKEVGSSASSSSLGIQFQNSGEELVMENELIVNEFLHEQQHTFAGSLNVTAEDQSSMKTKIKETMENAFWDGISDSMKQDEPKYDRVVELMREVRDEICEMAPQSWKEEIYATIDLDILSQMLNLGTLDMDYLGKILEFALITLQNLSAPANDDELKVVHQKVLKELAEICQAGDGFSHSHIIALIKGLRFILEQIQALKQEISKAHIKIMEPLLRGPAGLDYLKNAFSKRYGPSSDALTALPLTVRWLSSVWDSKDQEWLEHTNALSMVTRSQESSSQRLLPSTTLRTGGNILGRMNGTSKNATNATGSDNKHPECEGEKVDLLMRLGLLKLVTGVSDLTQETLPETLKLNLARLRAVQAQLQKIIVISTSILVLRQTLISEQMVRNPADMESMVLSCVKQLSELLDSVEDAGIKEIIKILGTFTAGDQSGDSAKLQSWKNVMARLLTKSLQAGDPVFVRVSHAVYLAARGIVLGGSAPRGRELAEMALRQVGAAVLLDRVVEVATVLLVASTVSCGVHGPWYAHLIEKM